MRWVRALAVAAGLLAAVVSGPVAEAQPRYSLMNVGSFGQGNTYPTDMNDLGQVVGYSLYAPFTFHGFRTASNAPINPATDDVGTFGGPTYSYAYAINNLGQVVGEAGAPGTTTQIFRTAPNRPINPLTDNLGAASGRSGSAFGINDLGEVVGYMAGPTSGARAFRTAPNGPINPVTDDLGRLRSNSFYVNGTGINDLGQVVGVDMLANGVSPMAFRTAPHADINPATDNLGSLGGDTYVGGINNLGQVVGMSLRSGQMRAFRTRPSARINSGTDDLGTLGGASGASDINDFGVVVGASENSSGQRLAFVHDGTRMYNLNGLLDATGAGWLLVDAVAVNNRGQILVQGYFGADILAAVLTPIPEPGGAIVAALCGGPALLRRGGRSA